MGTVISTEKTVSVQAVADYAHTLAPVALALERDNVGLLVDSKTPVTGILCALDITRAVADEAAALGCELIVSHHPIIYKPMRALCAQDVPYVLAQRSISALCLHTNLDTASGGVNDVLAARLGLQEVRPFGSGMGRIGTLPTPVDEAVFLRTCADSLHAVIQATPCGAAVRTVAVLGGSGGDEMQDAFAAGADAFVTGEAGHHCGVGAVHAGKLLVVAGHYETERPVVPVLAQKLQEAFPHISVRVSSAEQSPFLWESAVSK